MARQITGINDIPTNFDENKQGETHTIKDWCLKLGLSLIDTKYFEDDNKYTIQEFENIVPRDIQIPIPGAGLEDEEILSQSKEERLLNSTIECFYKDKQKLDYYKKETDSANKEIKEMLQKLNKTEFETDNGLVAKITTSKRESFDENRLIEKLKVLNGFTAIKTKEYVDMDELENLIYNGSIDASQLSSCKISKEIVTLKVSERKSK